MVLKRSAPARRCASAAVSSGSTATGAAWGWRERNVKVRSSTMTARITTTTSKAPRILFTIHHSLVCGGGRSSRDSGHLARGVLTGRSEEHTSELQSLAYLVCRLLLEKKKQKNTQESNKLI